MKKIFAISLSLLAFQACAMNNESEKKALEKGYLIALEACLNSCHTTYNNRLAQEKSSLYRHTDEAKSFKKVKNSLQL